MDAEREKAKDTIKVRIVEQNNRLYLARRQIGNIELSPQCADQVSVISGVLTSSIQAEVDHQWIQALAEVGILSPQNFLDIWNRKDELSRQAHRNTETDESTSS